MSGSDRQPPVCQTGALPVELIALVPSGRLELPTRGFTGRYPRPGVSMGRHSRCWGGRWDSDPDHRLHRPVWLPLHYDHLVRPRGVEPPRPCGHCGRSSSASFNTGAGTDTGIRTPATSLRGTRANRYTTSAGLGSRSRTGGLAVPSRALYLLSYTQYLVPSEGFEPPAPGFEDRRSVH